MALEISNHHRGAQYQRDAYCDDEEKELAHQNSCGRHPYGACVAEPLMLAL